MVAETAQRTPSAKAEILLALSELDVIGRVVRICGAEATKALALYSEFLEKLSDERFRKMADTATLERGSQPEEFRYLKNKSQYFSWELDRLLHVVYGSSHPIHHAVVF